MNIGFSKEVYTLWYRPPEILLGGNYDAKADITPGNSCTTSNIRYDFHKLTLQENPFSVIGGPSVRWLKESLSVPEKLDSRVKDLRDPVLLIQGERVGQ